MKTVTGSAALSILSCILLVSCPAGQDGTNLQLLDDIPPSIEITSHEHGNPYEPITTIEGRSTDIANDAGDAGEVTAISFSVNNGSTTGSIATDDDGLFSFDIVTTGTLGTILLQITAVDWNGNTSTVDLSLTPPKQVLNFGFLSGDNAELVSDAWGTIEGTSISVAIPQFLSSFDLIPVFEHTGVSITVGGSDQLSGISSQVFSLPVTYRVSANDGTFSDYLVLLQSRNIPYRKIADSTGGFTGSLADGDHFGTSVASLGDLDGDGNVDLAAGAPTEMMVCSGDGSVWILFLDSDGTVKSQVGIGEGTAGFSGILDSCDQFGKSVHSPGDINGDGIVDLIVGASNDDDGGADNDANRGAVWVIFLDSDGTAKSSQKISDSSGKITGILDDFDLFGSSVASPGDLDGNGVPDIVVGAPSDDDGGSDNSANRGAVWVLFLDSDGTVNSNQKISATAGGFGGTIDDGDAFGTSIASPGDIDSDGISDLAVGAAMDNDGGGHGAVWILFMNADGTVKSEQKISDTSGTFDGILDDWDYFGHSVSSLGDFDGDGLLDLLVGAHEDDDGGSSRGAVWALFLNVDGTVKSHQKISDTGGGFGGVLDDYDMFGSSLTSVPDIDGDGKWDIIVGALADDEGGSGRGAIWILSPSNTWLSD